MTKKLPADRRPFDPARAARERNEAAAAAAANKPTTPNRTTRRIGLRPATPKPSADE